MLKLIAQVLKKITKEGYKAYIVGGFVRDYYLNRKSSDFDICTNARPDKLKKIFKKVISINDNCGNVIIQFKNKRFDITTFRRDLNYLANRKLSKMVCVDTLIEDLKRRDFTINTLCFNDKLQYVDLMNARKDIDNKLIKTVGDPYHKIKEDTLRILRAIRFATILNFKLDDGLRNAIIVNKLMLQKLSYERRKQELDQIFKDPNKQYGIDLIIKLGLSNDLELYNLNDIVLTDDYLGIWAQLDNIKYPFTKLEKSKIKLIKHLVSLSITPALLFEHGIDIYKVICQIKKQDYNDVIRIYKKLPIHSLKDIQVTFKDITSKLVNNDKKFISTIYKAIVEKIINNEIKNNYQDIINYISIYNNK